jgi:hypothetical protein
MSPALSIQSDDWSVSAVGGRCVVAGAGGKRQEVDDPRRVEPSRASPVVESGVMQKAPGKRGSRSCVSRTCQPPPKKIVASKRMAQSKASPACSLPVRVVVVVSLSGISVRRCARAPGGERRTSKRSRWWICVCERGRVCVSLEDACLGAIAKQRTIPKTTRSSNSHGKRSDIAGRAAVGGVGRRCLWATMMVEDLEPSRRRHATMGAKKLRSREWQDRELNGVRNQRFHVRGT